ncbi:glycosyltransferase family 2 protein [Baaleninema sp.]|uniref:glycosyltransferase family 2 protein n=1 Tax=Baaleninema sp. TaxID=3101197 RepID=UPI003D05C96F
MTEISLSAIVTYRNRPTHLKTLLDWWTTQASPQLRRQVRWILVEADDIPSEGLETELAEVGVDYLFVENVGRFHKTRALNLALSQCGGQFVTPFDVDLLPVGDTLERHLELAQASPKLLVTGYRVMSPTETANVAEMSPTLEQCEIAPEDRPSALWKHLLRGERFGVLPMFDRRRLWEIGGWDEAFVGWGAEDQDLIERYLEDGRSLCRCPDLLYLHLSHPPTLQWRDAESSQRNRQHYYRKMQHRRFP